MFQLFLIEDKNLYRIIIGISLVINDFCLWSKILMTIYFPTEALSPTKDQW